MPKPRMLRASPGKAKSKSLMVRLDEASKTALKKAAELRRITISEYVRTVTVAQARLELKAARAHVIRMTPAEEMDFWKALNDPVKLTAAQRKLGKLMRELS